MRKFSLSVLFIIMTAKAWAGFDYNANCVQAYKALSMLKLTTARTLIDREKALHPGNSITILLDNYYDYYKILTTENKAEFDRLKGRRSDRLDALDDEDESSPYYNFAQAEINLQWALLHSRFGEFTTAGFCINKAYRLLQENQKKFPGFLPDDIPMGVVNVLLDVLPDGALKSTLGFFGIRGSTTAGMGMLQRLAAQLPQSGYAMYQPELTFYLTFIQTDVLNDPAAYSKMQQYTVLIDSSSLLKTYVKGYVALRTGHSTESIGFLQNRPPGSDYQPFAYLDYLQGMARLNIGDNDSATDYFNKFLRTNKGNNNIKDCYLHLAWIGVLAGDIKRYQAFAQLAKSKGSSYVDRDKQALVEINEGMPDKTLLQARLYYDGGLYAKALALLKDKNTGDFASVHDKAEYFYRLARIYEAQDKAADALNNYRQAINTGRNTTYYFAAAAAQKAGYIYEQHKNNSQAVAYYNIAISLKTTHVNASYQQKAKMGLKRLKA